jgi:uridine kinase
MKALITNAIFPIGLAIRLVLIAFVLPQAETLWYLPFLDISVSVPTIDPWRTFLDAGGNVAAFPYGYVMWFVFLPLTLIAKLIGAPLHLAYGLTLLAVDIVLLLVLRWLFEARVRALLLLYWLSPIVLLATFWLGLNDLIPVTLLCLALCFTRRLHLFPAGVLCGAAISAKLSMLLPIPFFLIYLFRNRTLRSKLPSFLQGLGVALAVFCLPFLFSSAGVNMLLSNPEMGKVYQFVLQIGSGAVIYVVPLAYLLMLYGVWRVRRLNFELFGAVLGFSFLLVVLLTPASPGWFIWVLPFLVAYQLRSGSVAIALVAAFSILYVVTNLFAAPIPSMTFDFGLARGVVVIDTWFDGRLTALFHTVLSAIGIILAIRILRETVSTNDYFRLSRKPFVIGIAGDSGAGKDTLVDALSGLFGDHSVAHLSGDDYHLWDRQKPMWQVMTHLNPMANNLEGLANDLAALTDGKTIVSRHYNHATGKMSHPVCVRSNDFIVVSGLHALYLPMLRTCYDLSIYLDIDEGLRRHLKLQRDVGERGHSVERVLTAIQKREPDSARFVRPQAAHADLIISLQPIHPRSLDDADKKRPLRFKLFVRSRNGLNELSLVRVLIGVCGLHVDLNMGDDATTVDLTIEGETSAEDIPLAAKILFPRILEFLDITPQWQSGVLGLMQLITLSHINQALSRRLI